MGKKVTIYNYILIINYDNSFNNTIQFWVGQQISTVNMWWPFGVVAVNFAVHVHWKKHIVILTKVFVTAVTSIWCKPNSKLLQDQN